MNRNTSFFWLTDGFENADQDDSSTRNDVQLQDTGLSIDDDNFVEGTASSGTILQVQRHEHFPSRTTFLPPPPSGNEEAQPLLVGAQSYGSQERPLFALTENLPVERTPPILHRRRHVTNMISNNNVNKNPATILRQNIQPLRFQVVIWHVGEVDVIHGQVPMRFRITLFWNDVLVGPSITSTTTSTSDDSTFASLNSSTGREKACAEAEWIMKGRQRACRYYVGDDQIQETIDVPPVSILNAVSFDPLETEITMLDPDTRLMRWTCMYRGDLFQADHMTVEQFPHDWHQLKIKIGILAHRGPGCRWDRRIYPLALATESDSRGSTRIPHGLVVEHVAIPDFDYSVNELSFSFLPLKYGVGCSPSSGRATQPDNRDRYLQVQLPVYRVSGHYDRSIMPLLLLLNVVAITCIPRNFDSATASTEILLGIAFVQVGIRLTIDSRLPSVGYPIKMQKVLNHAFWMICSLALESNVVFFLVMKRGWKTSTTDRIDFIAAVVALCHTAWIFTLYYSFERRTMAATTAPQTMKPQ